MSLKKIASQIQSVGAKNSPRDQILAHITPREAKLLKMFGGSGHSDPQTGLLHFDDGYGGGYGGGDGGDWGGTGGGPGAGYGNSGESPGYGGDGYGGTGSPGFGYGDGSGPGLSGDFSGWGTSESAMWGGSDSFDGSDFSGDYGLEGLHYGDPSYAATNSPVNSSTAVPSPEWMSIARKVLGLMPLNPMAKQVANLGINAATNTPASSVIGNNAVGMIGSAFGPMGSVAAMGLNALGLGNAIGRGLGKGDASAVGSSSGAKGFGGGAEMLGGLYSMWKGNQTGNQAKTLNNLYGQTSPYAQQLRQQLERRDAAGGRRSQYGPREVELQAKLADMYSRNVPNMMALNDQRNQQQARGLGLLFSGADRLGYMDKARDWIANLGPGSNTSIPQSSGTLGSLYGNEGYGDLWSGSTPSPVDYGEFF